MSRSPQASLTLAADTDPDAHALQIELYRRMTGAERLAIAFRLTEMTREAAIAGIRARHPDYDEDDVHAAFRRLWLGVELTLAAWPEQPLVDP